MKTPLAPKKSQAIALAMGQLTNFNPAQNPNSKGYRKEFRTVQKQVDRGISGRHFSYYW